MKKTLIMIVAGFVFFVAPTFVGAIVDIQCPAGQSPQSVLITPAVPAVTHTEVVVDTEAWDETVIDTPAIPAVTETINHPEQTTAPVFSCPDNYHYQNNGNWSERCHRDNQDINPEHTSPLGVLCPTGYTQAGTNENTTCKIAAWDEVMIITPEIPAVTHIVHHDAVTHEKIVIDTPAVDAVYEMQCVKYPTHRWCTAQENGSYIAQALPDSQENPTGYPWTSNNPTCIDLCSQVEGLQITTELCPAPVDGYWSDWSPKSEQCGFSGEQTRTYTPAINGGVEVDPQGATTKPYTNNACIVTHSSGGSSTGGSIPFGFTPAVGRVLGASTSCLPYLNTYINPGDKDSSTSEVSKLQSFLNDYLGVNLKIDGVYGKKTESELKAFQVKNFDDILAPWVNLGTVKSDTKGTGYVYKTTQRKINLIKCPELDLPLPALQ